MSKVWKMLALLAISASCFTAACTLEPSEDGDPQRGPLGKADIVGSCETSQCDGPAATGNCWCDDECEAYGDCCEDYEAVCRQPTCEELGGQCVTEPGNENFSPDCQLHYDAEELDGTCEGFAELCCDIPPQPEPEPERPERFMVSVVEDADFDLCVEEARAVGEVEVLTEIPSSNLFVVEATEDTIEQIDDLPCVDLVEPDEPLDF